MKFSSIQGSSSPILKSKTVSVGTGSDNHETKGGRRFAVPEGGLPFVGLLGNRSGRLTGSRALECGGGRISLAGHGCVRRCGSHRRSCRDISGRVLVLERLKVLERHFGKFEK